MSLVRLLLLLFPARLRREHGTEMEAFLETRYREALARRGGMAAFTIRVIVDAVRTRISGGGPATRRHAHQVHRSWTTEGGMGAWRQDLAYGLRRLMRTPLFTVGALAVVALAIGANTAGFALVDGVLFEPLPYADVGRVVNVYQDSDDGQPSAASYPAYRELTALEAFEVVGATSPSGASLTVGGSTEAVSVEYATSSLFPALGLTPQRGRWFEPAMDQVGAGFFAVVSHATWRSRFGGDPSIIGRTVELNRQPVQIIGIGPRDYNGVLRFVVTDFWLSISSNSVGGDFRVANLDRRQDHWYEVRARLAEGASVEQARRAADRLASHLAQAYPELNEGRGMTVLAASDVRVRPGEDAALRATAGALMAVVGLVLLLAATNLGSLLLVRGLARAPEVAVRRALGAGGSRVAGLFLAEGLILAVVGGGLGLALAYGLVSALNGLPNPAPVGGAFRFSIDGSVVSFNLGLMVATGLFFGWAPALQFLRSDVSGALREDRSVMGLGRGMAVFRNGMVAVQVAVSLVLVVGASLMARTLVQYQQVDPGVDADRLAFIATTFSQGGVEAEERAPVLGDVVDRVRTLPGVRGVALTSRLPVSEGGSTTTVVEDYRPAAGTGALELDFMYVSPGYFDVVGIPLLAGRGYTVDDQIGSRRFVVVNETAAVRFWGDVERAVGGRVRPQGAPDAWIQVAGVVADARVSSLGEPPTPMLYYVMPESGTDAPYLLVRTDGDPAALLGGMRASLQEVNPRLPVDRLDTLVGHLGEGLAGPRLTAALLGLFSALALLLASVGVYTVVSLAVAARRSEIGLRMALGAARGRVVRLVAGRVLLTVGAGFALGGAVVLLVAPRVRSFLYGVEPYDPAALALALSVLGAAVALASYLPARRAARMDPVEALKGP